ncbi:MAG: ribose 5-phosphate isomerase B [Bacteroidales bacterium]|nr:ribose 5-phosphate isomerase B [Bacteroidales bacterium]
MKVFIASDHAGFDLKESLKKRFADKFEFEDFGAFSTQSVDYPEFAHKLAQNVLDTNQYGVLICGTGNGMAMTANKHAGIRAGLCWNKDIAALIRQHNDANILVMPARFIPEETAFEILETFFATEFEGGRHQRRVEKINLV